MRLPSIDELRAHAAAAFRRFPWTISAGLASAFMVIAAAEEFADVFSFLTPGGEGIELLVATTLALPLFFTVRLAQERALLSRGAALVVRLLGVVALGAVVWAWPGWSEKLQFLHYAQISLGLHLAAAVVPFLPAGELNGFWQYNRALFLRFLIGALYSVVLFGGLAIALVAIDNLFGLDIHEELYLDLWGVVAFAFQTWFFTAGAPNELDSLEALDDYPRGLKLFAQYVLIPLVSVYLAILTAYLVKVVVTTEWPSGWIGWLVSCVSVAGILSILLTHPIRHRRENTWIVTYGRWFWIVMLPSVVMLLLAVWKRIDQYGVTEPRYFLAVLTLWLGGMAVLYGFVRSQNIKWLPASLCLLAFVTLVGPWSAYSVSRASQMGRLTSILERNELIVDGRWVEASAAAGDTAAASGVPLEDRRELGAIVAWMFEHRGSEPLADLLGPELAVTDSAGGTGPVRSYVANERAAEVMDELGLEYVGPSATINAMGYFNFSAESGVALETAGYDYVLAAGQKADVKVGDRELSFELEDSVMHIRSEGVTLLDVPLAPMAVHAIAAADSGFVTSGDQLPRDILRVEASSPVMRAVFYPIWVNGRRVEGGDVEVNNVNGTWLLSFRETATGMPDSVSTAPTGSDSTEPAAE
ncbi:MAG: DUF4153 domain-containing protein [Gemmatimonadales bacterium]|jgi:hypothetical protein